MGILRKELLYVVIIGFGSASVGTMMAYYSPAHIPMVNELQITEKMGTLFNMLGPLCAFIGSPMLNVVTPFLGRKKSSLVFGILNFASWLMIAFTQTHFKWLVFLGQSLQGVSTGMLSAICSCYIVEISPIEQKASYGAMHQIMICFAGSITFLLGIWFSWRKIALMLLTFSGLHISLLPFIPDSDTVSTIPCRNQDSLFSRKYLKSIFCSVVFVTAQQWAGINARFTNLEGIFIQAGVAIKPSICAFITGSAQSISGIVAVPLLSRFGRKAVWIISCVGQIVALLLGWANELWPFSNYAPLISLFLDVLLFGVGFGPIPWFIVPELFPDSVRALAQSLATSVNWLMASIVVLVWPLMNEAMGLGWAFFSFSGVIFLSLLFGIFVMPETQHVFDRDQSSTSGLLQDAIYT